MTDPSTMASSTIPPASLWARRNLIGGPWDLVRSRRMDLVDGRRQTIHHGWLACLRLVLQKLLERAC